jgi:hypothetical protein
LGSCFSACPRNTTRRLRQLADPPQTVLLTEGLRSNPQNNRLIPKFSEAEINPKTNNINTFYMLKREGKPRNGVNCSQNDSANKASVAGARFG